MAKVSVVVPARNEEDFLPHCLIALSRQTHKEFELIVVDSASTDHTYQVARSFEARVVRLDEPGVGLARQAGFDVATGDIVVSTDADAIPSPDWLERIVTPFDDPQVAGVFGTIELTGGRVWPHIAHTFFKWFQAINMLIKRPLFCGPNFAVRRRAFIDVGGFMVDGEYPDEAEDMRLAQKIDNAGKIVFLRNLKMIVSSRRLENGEGLRYTGHHAGVYLKVWWLKRLPIR